MTPASAPARELSRSRNDPPPEAEPDKPSKRSPDGFRIQTSPPRPTHQQPRGQAGNDLPTEPFRGLGLGLGRAPLFPQFPERLLQRTGEQRGFRAIPVQSPIGLPRGNTQAQHRKQQHAAKRCHDHGQNEQDIARLEHPRPSAAHGSELQEPSVERRVPVEQTLTDHTRGDGAHGEKRPKWEGVLYIAPFRDDQANPHDGAEER